MVVFVAPVINEEASFCEGGEPVLVETVVAEGAVEGFDEGVLHGFAWLDVIDRDARALRPEVESATGELGAVIGGDGGGQAAGTGELFEDRDDGSTANGGIDVQGHALAGGVIDERETAEAAAAGELVVNEVHAPALIGRRWVGPRDASDRREFAAVLAAQGEAFLAIEPLGAFVVDDEPLGLEDSVQDGRPQRGLSAAQ